MRPPRILAAAAATAFAGLLAGAETPARPSFSLQYMAVHGRRIDTIVYDFTGDGRPDVMNSSIDFDADPATRWLALHPQNEKGGYAEKPVQIWPVDPRACALSFGDFLPGGGIEPGFIAADGVYVYAWRDGAFDEEPEKLLHTRTYFTTPSARSLPVWQWASDLSNDKLHDLVLPVPEGYKICFQTGPGKFGRIFTLEADLKRNRALPPQRWTERSQTLTAHFASTVSIPRVVTVDIDGDGLLDLVSIEGHLLTVFFQKEPKTFSSAAGWRWRFPVTTLESEAKKDAVEMALVDFKDIDGDRNADLVVTRVYGEVGLLESIKTTVYVHLGNGRGQYTPTHRIMIDGVSVDPDFVDMNGDGKLDCITSRLRTDLVGQGAKGLLLGDVSMDYEVFQFDPATNGYQPSPTYSYPVRVTLEDIQKKGVASRPLLFARGDFSGDGRPDQVRLNPKTDEIELHEGRDTAWKLIDFTPTPWAAYKPERPPKDMRISDVNGDGISDVILLYSGQIGLLLSTRG